MSGMEAGEESRGWMEMEDRRREREDENAPRRLQRGTRRGEKCVLQPSCAQQHGGSPGSREPAMRLKHAVDLSVYGHGETAGVSHQAEKAAYKTVHIIISQV